MRGIMNENGGALDSTKGTSGSRTGRWIGLGLGLGVLALAFRGGRRRVRLRRKRNLRFTVGALAGLAVATAIAGARARRVSARRASAKRAKGPLAATITIARPAATIYGFWRGSQNWHRFIGGLERVESRGDGRLLIQMRRPFQEHSAWQLRTTEDHPNESLTWEATTEDGARLYTATVRFAAAPGGRGTEVTYELALPSSDGGGVAKSLFRHWTAVRLANDLRRLKQVLETGHVAKSDASIHVGPHPARPEAAPVAAAVSPVTRTEIRRELAEANRVPQTGAAPAGGGGR